MSAEQWKAIPGFQHFYASDQGRIRRGACVTPRGRHLRERVIAQRVDRSRNGYSYVLVHLLTGKGYRPFSVARLVLLAWCGGPQDGEECRHLNDNSEDCRLANLRWGTRQENRDDMVRNGRSAAGERNGAAVLSSGQVRLIRNIYKKGSHTCGASALAYRFGVHVNTISDVVTRRTWRDQ